MAINKNTVVRTILLIDDDSDEHKFFCSTLFEYNSTITCVTAFNCNQGYEIAQNKKPDVIFLDMNLPGTNGIACLRKFKKSALQNIPIYIYSGGIVTEREKELAVESGAVKWLTKPNNLEGYSAMFSQYLY